MVAPVLLIDCWPDPLPAGTLRDRFRLLPPLAAAHGLELLPVAFQRVGGDLPPTAGVILSGSPTNLVEDPAEDPVHGAPLARFAPLLAALARLRAPVLGICFGHQLLERAAGGRLERLPTPREAPHHRVMLLRPDPLLADIPEPAFVENHAWRVAAAAPGTQVIAQSEDGIEMVRQPPLRIGVQFHPEYYDRQPPAAPWGRVLLERWFAAVAAGRLP